MKKRILFFSLILGLLAEHALAQRISQVRTPFRQLDHVPGEILVKYKSGVDAQSQHLGMGLQKSAQSLGTQQSQSGIQSQIQLVRLEEGHDVEAAVIQARQNDKIEWAQPNYVYHASAIPNDPDYGQLWGLKNSGQTILTPSYATNNPGIAGVDINAEAAWDQSTDCSSVIVAVVDTGVLHTHEDLAANMWDDGQGNPGTDIIDGDSDPTDLNGHGTHVAGTIAAVGNNGIGGTGVCWSAQIMAVRSLDADGSGTTASVLSGIDYAVQNGASVINLSLGGPQYDQAFYDSIAAAQEADVVVVVAAGNSGANLNQMPDYPCAFDLENILCVAAIDQAGELASFSNYGTDHADIGAPGTNILSSWYVNAQMITDDFTTWNHVTGWTGGPITLVDGGGNNIVYDMLYDPSGWYGGNYTNNLDDRVWKNFTIPAAQQVTVSYWFFIDLETNADYFKTWYDPLNQDPFASNNIGSLTGSSNGWSTFASHDLPLCANTTSCTVGFQMTSDAQNVDLGVGIYDFMIEAITPGNNGYYLLNGTSMATPHVAGAVALVRSQHPEYDHRHAIDAILGGGQALSSLSQVTASGNRLELNKALGHLTKPMGLTVTKQ